MIWVGKQNTIGTYAQIFAFVVIGCSYLRLSYARLPEALKCDFCARHNGTAEDQAALGIFTHPNISLISESVFESIFQG
jgi:hypothetical protein